MSEHAERLIAAVEAGTNVSANVASWRRCLRLYRLDPDRTHPPEHHPLALKAAGERDASFIAIARPYMEDLFRLFQNTGGGVLLSDRNALVLDIVTDWTHDSWNRKVEECRGTVYSERLLGTNSIGTCLAEGRGVTLRGGQHFMNQYRDVICVGAPIFAPLGEIVGCLVVTQRTLGHDARLDAFLSFTVATFARRIETEMFAKAFPKARLMLASPIGRLPCALLAVDGDDCVLGATRSARRLLALDDESLERGRSLSEVREMPARDTDLADIERRAITRALARHEGNLSATARTMGISRSTLYRKMEAYEMRGRG